MEAQSVQDNIINHYEEEILLYTIQYNIIMLHQEVLLRASLSNTPYVHHSNMQSLK